MLQRSVLPIPDRPHVGLTTFDAKDPANADRLTQVLFDAAEAIRLAAVLARPPEPGRGEAQDGTFSDLPICWRSDAYSMSS